MATTTQTMLSAVVPPGTILAYAGESAPSMYKLCDGASLSTTVYPDLFAVIKYTYGGSGSTFNLPNLGGRVPVGRILNDPDFGSLNQQAGARTVTLTSSQLPSHTHAITDKAHNHTTVANGIHGHPNSTAVANGSHSHPGSSTGGTGNHTHTGSTTQGGAHSHVYNGGSGGDSDGTTNVQHLANNYGSKNLPSGGDHAHSFSISSSGSHTHTVSLATDGNHAHALTIVDNGSHTHTVNNSFTGITGTNATGGGGAHNNLQPYIVLNYIIRY